jgi:uncharacterized protein DUF6900
MNATTLPAALVKFTEKTVDHVLTTRRTGGDFFEVAVWDMRTILAAAFKEGRKAAGLKAAPMEEALALRVAVKHFGVETLATRMSDSADFKEVAVWNLRDAMLEMYAAAMK